MRYKLFFILLLTSIFFQPIHSAYGSVSFSVMSQDHEPIKDASFQLIKDEQVYAENIKSDAKGKVMIENLETGSYRILQIETASGYEIMDDSYAFEYETGSKLVLDSIINQKKVGTVAIQIVNELEEPQQQYAFSLWNEAHTKQRYYKTDVHGYCILSDLTLQSYQIDLGSRQIDLAITDDNYQKDYELKIYTEKQLPFALKKQDFSLWYLSAALLIMIIAAAIYLYQKNLLGCLKSGKVEEVEESED